MEATRKAKREDIMLGIDWSNNYVILERNKGLAKQGNYYGVTEQSVSVVYINLIIINGCRPNKFVQAQSFLTSEP